MRLCALCCFHGTYNLYSLIILTQEKFKFKNPQLVISDYLQLDRKVISTTSTCRPSCLYETSCYTVDKKLSQNHRFYNTLMATSDFLARITRSCYPFFFKGKEMLVQTSIDRFKASCNYISMIAG